MIINETGFITKINTDLCIIKLNTFILTIID